MHVRKRYEVIECYNPRFGIDESWKSLGKFSIFVEARKFADLIAGSEFTREVWDNLLDCVVYNSTKGKERGD